MLHVNDCKDIWMKMCIELQFFNIKQISGLVKEMHRLQISEQTQNPVFGKALTRQFLLI